MQPSSATFFTKQIKPHAAKCIIIGITGDRIMGIHYDYKSTRGDKKLRKQQEREQRRRTKKTKAALTPKTDESRPLTLDMLTDPEK